MFLGLASCFWDPFHRAINSGKTTFHFTEIVKNNNKMDPITNFLEYLHIVLCFVLLGLVLDTARLEAVLMRMDHK